MLVGVVTGRRVIGVPTLVAAGTDKVVRVLAPAIQGILAPQPPTGNAREDHA